MFLNKKTAKDKPKTISMEPAVHRRILNFLNEAIYPADLEFANPLFIHDDEGVPIQQHVHEGLTVS